jgi:hypothetical protein
MTKRPLTEQEQAVLRRVSKLIRKKINFLSRHGRVREGAECPVSITQLARYRSGASDVPLCHLVSLFEFYGCSRPQLEMWNIKISTILFTTLNHEWPANS